MDEQLSHQDIRQTRFAVLAMSRVGSYMLTSLLNAHPSVVCFGELLKKNPLNSIDHLDLLGSGASTERWIEERLEKPVEFLEYCFASAGHSPKAVGFKLMLGQNPDALRYVVRDTSFRIIVLHRANILASYASQEVARATKQGVALEGEKIRTTKVEFHADKFERMCGRRIRLYNDVREQLQEVGKPFCDLEYRQVVQESGVKQAFSAIGMPISSPPRPKTLKRASGRLLDRFTNPKALTSHLEEIGQMQWLEPEF